MAIAGRPFWRRLDERTVGRTVPSFGFARRITATMARRGLDLGTRSSALKGIRASIAGPADLAGHRAVLAPSAADGLAVLLRVETDGAEVTSGADRIRRAELETLRLRLLTGQPVDGCRVRHPRTSLSLSGPRAATPRGRWRLSRFSLSSRLARPTAASP